MPVRSTYLGIATPLTSSYTVYNYGYNLQRTRLGMREILGCERDLRQSVRCLVYARGISPSPPAHTPSLLYLRPGNRPKLLRTRPGYFAGPPVYGAPGPALIGLS